MKPILTANTKFGGIVALFVAWMGHGIATNTMIIPHLNNPFITFIIFLVLFFIVIAVCPTLMKKFGYNIK